MAQDTTEVAASLGSAFNRTISAIALALGVAVVFSAGVLAHVILVTVVAYLIHIHRRRNWRYHPTRQHMELILIATGFLGFVTFNLWITLFSHYPGLLAVACSVLVIWTTLVSLAVVCALLVTTVRVGIAIFRAVFPPEASGGPQRYEAVSAEETYELGGREGAKELDRAADAV